MAFLIKIPFVIASHIKKYSSTASLKNKSKAAALGMVSGSPYFHDGTAVKQVGSYTPVNLAASTLTVTQVLHANRVVTTNIAAGTTITLPAATGTGDKYTFIVGTTATGSHIIKVANATDFMVGTAFFETDNAADAAIAFPTANTGTVATETDTITMNGTTTGGIKGARVEVIDIASAQFQVQVFSSATGTEATPFSAAV